MPAEQNQPNARVPFQIDDRDAEVYRAMLNIPSDRPLPNELVEVHERVKKMCDRICLNPMKPEVKIVIALAAGLDVQKSTAHNKPPKDDKKEGEKGK